MQLSVSHFCEAIAAVYRFAFGGLERNFAFLAAFCANCGEVLSLSLACVLSCISASFASLGFVLEALFCIEFLFTGGENEFVSAIFAH
jgi:hypothetical protein